MFSTLFASFAFTVAEPGALQNTASIPEVAVASKRLDTLVAAVKAAGLVDALAGDGPFTVFAPTDAAFGRLGEEALQ
ncbi:MAG: fasciclin domain-containing protein, partial [Planctomycetota bacterium]